MSNEALIICGLIGTNIATIIAAWMWKKESDGWEELVHIWQQINDITREQRDEAWDRAHHVK